MPKSVYLDTPINIELPIKYYIQLKLWPNNSFWRVSRMFDSILEALNFIGKLYRSGTRYQIVDSNGKVIITGTIN